MHDETNELNDIILNRSERRDSRKRMIVGIAALTVVLILVVIVMGKISGSTPTRLPQPKPSVTTRSSEASVPHDETDRRLTRVAETLRDRAATAASSSSPEPVTVKPLAKASEDEIVIIDETAENRRVTTVPARPAATGPDSAKRPVSSRTSKTAKPARRNDSRPAAGDVYIQVGSFSRYKPNGSFLKKIENSGYHYRFHRVVINGQIKNKVLVGPFADRGEARRKLNDVRRKIEPGAFIYTIKP